MPPATLIVIFLPLTVFTLPGLTSAAMTLAATTWYARIAASFSLFSGLRRVSTVPFGSFANAALVGANTVNGPSPLKVSTRPAAVTAATSVEKSSLPAAMPTMVLLVPGMMTVSITWITPLEPTMSVATTFAASTFTPPLVVRLSLSPLTVPTKPALTSFAITFAPTTMLASFSLFSGLSNSATVPFGSFAKAALVGAKTVNGPLLLKVSARPAALTAATSVEKSSLPAAISTIVLVGFLPW